jgi:hypothetical protein
MEQGVKLILIAALGGAIVALGVSHALADTTPSAEEPYPLECALIPSGGADHSHDPTDYTISAVLDDGTGSVFGTTYSPAYQGTFVPIVCREKQSGTLSHPRDFSDSGS